MAKKYIKDTIRSFSEDIFLMSDRDYEKSKRKQKLEGKRTRDKIRYEQW
jgi:hypothetical protein